MNNIHYTSVIYIYIYVIIYNNIYKLNIYMYINTLNIIMIHDINQYNYHITKEYIIHVISLFISLIRYLLIQI